MLGLQTAWHQLYPPTCLSCGVRVSSDHGLCPGCWREAFFIRDPSCRLCSTPMPGEATDDDVCDACLKTARPWDAGRAALVYTGTGRNLVMALKHGDRQDIAAPAAQWMARAAASLKLPDDALLVPVPLHWRRQLKRTFNQSALLARAVAKTTGLPFHDGILVRTRATVPLQDMSYADRFQTVQEAFAPTKHAKQVAGRTVVLVDDVITSGATLAACTEALRAAGAERVCVLALARAARRP